MSKLAGTEIIELFEKISPYLHDVIVADIGVSIARDGVYTVHIPTQKGLHLNIKKGDKVNPQSATNKALDTGKQVVRVVSKEKSPYGIAYMASAMPFKDGDRVVGCVSIFQDLDEVESVTAVSSNVASASEELTASLQEFSSRTSTLATTSRKLDALSKDLLTAASQTDEIVTFINGVDNQTNLLGLNAAIEAARVGDAGRGFGVVADEVRKLAVASATSAKNISQSLKTINQIMVELSKSINSIDQNVNEQNMIIQEIAQASSHLATDAAELVETANKMYPTMD